MKPHYRLHFRRGLFGPHDTQWWVEQRGYPDAPSLIFQTAREALRYVRNYWT